MTSGPRGRGEDEHDREVDRVHEQDRVPSWRLVTQPDRIGCGAYERADVVVGVDAALEVEVVVDHVVARRGRRRARPPRARDRPS